MEQCDNKNECSQMAKEFAEHAAERAVHKTFAILGVNVDDPQALEEFREDLRFGKRMRRAADSGFITAVTVFTGALLVAMWLGFIVQIKSAFK